MPAEELMGVRVLDAGPGFASGVQAVTNSAALTLGWFGVLADTMGGRPVAFSLPPRHGLSTVSMHLDLVRTPAAADLPEMAGAGRMLELGRSWGLCGLTVTGAGSRVLVVGSVRFLVYPMASAAEHFPSDGAAAVSAPGPVVRNGNLLTILELSVESAGDGRARLTFTPGPRHTNPFPIVHGGLHTALVDAAMTTAMAGVDGGAEMTLLSLDLTYHRPIPVGGSSVIVTAAVLNHGRRSALAEAGIVAPDGKALTTARGTFGLLGAVEPVW
jgi:uncharacterized protein (TIGR00369 family)